MKILKSKAFYVRLIPKDGYSKGTYNNAGNPRKPCTVSVIVSVLRHYLQCAFSV